MSAVRVRIRRSISADEERESERCYQQTRRGAEPWIQPLWYDPLRRVERDNPEHVDGNRMRCCNDAAQQDGVACGPARSDQIGRHQRLAVPRFERMKAS